MERPVHVTFKHTGERRYALTIRRADVSARRWLRRRDDIPHDLVHYLVEAELGLSWGVFGRAAQGGGAFIARAEGSARERARQRRKQAQGSELGGARA